MRILREQAWMDVAEVMAKRATCFRGNCGAVITYNRDVVSVGYNGPPSGEPHCRGNDCELSPSGGCLRSIHAERNAINRALAKRLVRLCDCEMYTLYSPCPACADYMLLTGIRRVFFRYRYRLVTGLEKLMNQPDCQVRQVTTAGMVIDERTRELMPCG